MSGATEWGQDNTPLVIEYNGTGEVDIPGEKERKRSSRPDFYSCCNISQDPYLN